MSASFASCTFLEQSSGDGYVTWGKRDLFTIKPLAASNTPSILVVGMDVQRATVGAIMTAAELTALFDQVGESGSLIVNWETHTAFLEGISGVTQQGIGNDLYVGALAFVRL